MWATVGSYEVIGFGLGPTKVAQGYVDQVAVIVGCSGLESVGSSFFWIAQLNMVFGRQSTWMMVGKEAPVEGLSFWREDREK